MQFRLIKSLTDDAYGRDISGQNVRMLEGTTHLVSIVDIEYYQKRTSGAFTWFEFVQADDVDATIGVFHLDENGATDGFILPSGEIQFFEDIIPGDSPAIAALQAALSAVQGVNSAQSTALATLAGQVGGIPALTDAVAAAVAVNATQTTNITNLTNALAAAVAINTAQNVSIGNIETVNTNQAAAITAIQGVNSAQATQLTAHTNEIAAIQSVNASQATALGTIQTAIGNLNTVSNAQSGAISAIQTALANLAFTEDQITPTTNNKKFTAADKTKLDSLWASYTESNVAAVVVSISSPTAQEGNNLVWNVQLSKTSIGQIMPLNLGGTAVNGQEITLPLVFSDGVARDGANALIPLGVTSFNVTLATIDKPVFGGEKTAILTIGGVSGTGTITLNDNPVATVASISSPTVAEGGTLNFVVTLSGASLGQNIPIIIGGSATSGLDYGAFSWSDGVTVSSGNLVVPAGKTTFTGSTLTANDTLLDPNETVTITMGGITGTGTITNVLPAEVSFVSSPSVTEGGVLEFTIVLNRPSNGQSFPFLLSGS